MGVRSQIVAGALGVSTGLGVSYAPVGDGLDPLRESAALALAAGLSHDQAVMAVAIAGPESGHSDKAVGDTTITDDTWGPSYGRWQIRCIWSERGTGSTRDCDALHDPTANVAAMAAISSGGTNWQPWTGYTSGAYLPYLDDAEKAVSDVQRTAAPAGKHRSVTRLGQNVWAGMMRSWLRTGQVADTLGVGGAWRAVDDAAFGTDNQIADSFTVEPRPATRVDKLDPEFGAALDAMLAEGQGRVSVTSGWRDAASQKRLWDEYQDGVGNPANFSDGVTCHSLHCEGRAADLAGDLTWAHANAARFGLVFPYIDVEPWHVELAG